jgi:hypothetical protein
MQIWFHARLPANALMRSRQGRQAKTPSRQEITKKNIYPSCLTCNLPTYRQVDSLRLEYLTAEPAEFFARLPAKL